MRPTTPTPRQKIFCERGYQQMSFGSRVPHAISVMPESRARNAWATPVPGGRATTEPLRTGCSSGSAPRWHRPRQLERAVAIEDYQDLLFGGMHVRWTGEHARIHFDVLQAGPAGARCARKISPSPSASDIRLDVLRIHDRRRATRGRLGPIEPRLAVPGVAGFNLDEAGNRPHRAAARQFARIKILAHAERDHVETVVAGSNRVCLVGALIDDAVARANLVRVVVEQRQSRAAKHVEDLLGSTVNVRRRRLLAGLELDPGHARFPATGGSAERRQRGGHLASFPADLLDVVPVRDAHAATLCDRL